MTIKTHDLIFFALLLVMAAFGVLSYFFKPLDPENAKYIIGVIGEAVGMILAFKFGVHAATPAAPITTPSDPNQQAQQGQKDNQ